MNESIKDNKPLTIGEKFMESENTVRGIKLLTKLKKPGANYDRIL
jgi:hypothetical protein